MVDSRQLKEMIGQTVPNNGEVASLAFQQVAQVHFLYAMKLESRTYHTLGVF